MTVQWAMSLAWGNSFNLYFSFLNLISLLLISESRPDSIPSSVHRYHIGLWYQGLRSLKLGFRQLSHRDRKHNICGDVSINYCILFAWKVLHYRPWSLLRASSIYRIFISASTSLRFIFFSYIIHVIKIKRNTQVHISFIMYQYTETPNPED